MTRGIGDRGTIEGGILGFLHSELSAISIFLPISVFCPRWDPKEAGWGPMRIPMVRARTDNNQGDGPCIVGYNMQTH